LGDGEIFFHNFSLDFKDKNLGLNDEP
jgi:hypothetical protein